MALESEFWAEWDSEGVSLWWDMAAFARAKLGFLKLEHGPPRHDTFSRVFRLLAPEPFEAALRGAYERGRKSTPLHLVNVWAAEAPAGDRPAPSARPQRGARRPAGPGPPASGRLHRHRRRLHCRADTAQAILDTGADYAPALKANQPTLLAKAQAMIEAADPATEAIQPPAKAHDRIEGRTALVVPAKDMNFPGIAAVARVETYAKRAGDPEPVIVRFFLLSTLLSPERMLQVARTHWTIQNQLHWVLDVAFDGDAARSRKDNAPQNLALIRKLALNILRQNPEKASIKVKIKRAGWDDTFLLSLLRHMR
jgi:predicted transposase YbfD/YdcC